MITIISSAKTMDFSKPTLNLKPTYPIYTKDADNLAKICSKFSLENLGKLLEVNDKLAKLNYDRFQNFISASKKPAILAYSGDVFQQLDKTNFDDNDLSFADQHIAIISGLYGILKAMDFIAPYRLEIATRLSTEFFGNLYSYWTEKITSYFNNALLKETNSKYIINLASEEYSKSIDRKKLTFPLVSISFKQMRKNKLENIGILTKKARGKMLNMIIQNKIDDIDNLKSFSDEGYQYTPENSDSQNLVFTTNLYNL